MTSKDSVFSSSFIRPAIFFVLLFSFATLELVGRSNNPKSNPISSLRTFVTLSTISEFHSAVGNSGMKAMSDEITFITSNGTLFSMALPPDIPSLLSPSDLSTNVSVNPTLTWGSSVSATFYHLQVSTDSSFASLVVDDSTITDTSSNLSGLDYYKTYYWRVRAGNGEWSSFTDFYSFTTELSTVTLSSPANGALNTDTSVSLLWFSSASVDTYYVQVATDNLFTSIITNTTTTDTSFLQSGLSYAQNYYWRIFGSDNGRMITDTVSRNFTVKLGPVTLDTPADLAVRVNPNGTFVWTSSVGATSYAAEFSTDSTFATVNVSASGITDTSSTFSGLDTYTRYFWRVRGLNVSGGLSDWSTVLSFTTRMADPTLVSPANLSPGNSIHPVLIWRVEDGAQDYRLQFSADAGFSSLMYDSILTDTTFTVDSILANNTLYYWRVLAMNDDDTTNYTSRSFRTILEVVPTLNHPINNALVYSLDPVVYWNISVASTGISYDVLYSTDSLFSPALTTVLDAGSSIQDTLTGLLPATHYYWRVRTKNSSAIITYSSIEDFTTYGEVNTLPVPSYPTGGTTVYTLSPSLYWYLPVASYGYTFDVRYKETSSGTWNGPFSAGSSLNYALSGLSAGTSYDWQVRSLNGVDTSDWSATQVFVTSSISSGVPVTPSITYPTNEVTVYSLVPTIYWSLGASTIGLTFDLELYTDTTASAVVSATGITDLFYQVPTLTPGTTYFARVRSDNGSTQSAWSDFEAFTTFGVTGTLVPVLSYPISGAVIYTNTATLYWYVVGSSDTISYELQLKAGDTLFTTSISVDSNSYTTGTLLAGTTYYWRVRSFNGSAYSDYTDIDSFYVTGNAGTLVPNLTWPVGGAITSTSTDLYWYVNGYAPTMTYSVEYASESDFSNAVTVTTSSTTTSLTGLVPGVLYYWRVRTYNGSTYSAYSATETFVTSAGSAPVRPIGGSPIDNVTLNTNNVDLSWFVPTGTSGLLYELQYSLNPDFSGAVTIGNLTGTHHTVVSLPSGAPVYWRVRSKTISGAYSAYSEVERFIPNSPTSVKADTEIPVAFELRQNYPNPFNPSTTISYALPQTSAVTLKVYNMIGQVIQTLVENEIQPAGVYDVVFDASSLPSGIYLVRIETPNFTSVRKMTLLK